MPHRPLLDLQVLHAAFDDERCDAVAVVPRAATLRRLANLGVLARPLPGGLRLLAEVDSSGHPLRPAHGKVQVSFDLRATDAAFAAVTDLAPLAALDAPRFTRAGPGDALALGDTGARHSLTVQVARPRRGERFGLDKAPNHGASIAATGAVFMAYHPATRQVSLDTRAAAVGDPVTLRYGVAAQLPAGVIATVELDLTLPPDQPLPDPPARHTVRFAPRRAHQIYYVVAQNAGSPSPDLRIVETGAPAGPAFFPTSRRTAVTASVTDTDPVGAGLARRTGAASLTRFLSGEAVPLQRRPARQFSLTAGGTTLLSALPAAPPTQMARLVQGDGTRIDAVYQTVSVVLP